LRGRRKNKEKQFCFEKHKQKKGLDNFKEGRGDGD
jgi:hypothetical protein